MTLKTGAELRAWRLRHGIKQHSMARVLGVTPRSVQIIELKNKPLSVVWQWALEGIVAHVEKREVPPLFVCGDYFEYASTRRTPDQ